MGFLEGTVYEKGIVERARESYDGGIDEDVALCHGRPQRQALQAAATRQRHVGLTTCEGTGADVDNGVLEGKSLAFVDSERPSEL